MPPALASDSQPLDHWGSPCSLFFYRLERTCPSFNLDTFHSFRVLSIYKDQRTEYISLFAWQELNLEMEDQQENLDALEHLVTDLSSCGFALDLSQHQDRVQNLKDDFTELQKTIKER